MRLKSTTSPEWLPVVLNDFDAFLLDHASCERKASGTAMSLVAHYPDKKELLDAMIDMAIEELEHFRQVYRLIEKRGLMLGPDSKNVYIGHMQKLARNDSQTYFLDRLLIAGAVEARGCERFGLVAKGHPDQEVREFYMEITRSEARHHGQFVRLAKLYFDPQSVDDRLEEILSAEAEIIATLELKAAVH
jgi:tRNA-(ms[2]io[6]A)-hydroxylase